MKLHAHKLFVRLGGFLLPALLLAGCGGSGGSGARVTPGIGKATVSVTWPTPTRGIPYAANAIAVQIVDAQGNGHTAVAARPASGNASSANFVDLAAGPATISAFAYVNATSATVTVDANHLPVPTPGFIAQGGHLSASDTANAFTIVAGQTIQETVTLASTVDQVSVVFTPLSSDLYGSGNGVQTASSGANATTATLMAGYFYLATIVPNSDVPAANGGNSLTLFPVGNGTAPAFSSVSLPTNLAVSGATGSLASQAAYRPSSSASVTGYQYGIVFAKAIGSGNIQIQVSPSNSASDNVSLQVPVTTQFAFANYEEEGGHGQDSYSLLDIHVDPINGYDRKLVYEPNIQTLVAQTDSFPYGAPITFSSILSTSLSTLPNGRMGNGLAAEWSSPSPLSSGAVVLSSPNALPVSLAAPAGATIVDIKALGGSNDLLMDSNWNIYELNPANGLSVSPAVSLNTPGGAIESDLAALPIRLSDSAGMPIASSANVYVVCDTNGLLHFYGAGRAAPSVSTTGTTYQAVAGDSTFALDGTSALLYAVDSNGYIDIYDFQGDKLTSTHQYRCSAVQYGENQIRSGSRLAAYTPPGSLTPTIFYTSALLLGTTPNLVTYVTDGKFY